MMRARRWSGGRRPSPSGPDARGGRSRLSLLLPAFALLLGALFPSTAAAQAQNADTVTLVSNLNVSATDSRWSSLGNYSASTGFRTGTGASHGYYVTNVKASLRISEALTNDEIAKVRAELWINSDNNTLRPYSKFADLTVPSDLSDGNVSFGANRVLPNGTYHLVVYAVDGLEKVQARVINAHDEDVGAASGWNILNHSNIFTRVDPYDSRGRWSKFDTPMRIAVDGWARTQLRTPRNVVRTPGDRRITVSWIPVDNADRYVIEFGESGSGQAQKLTVNGATTHTITGLDNGTSYSVRVLAQNSAEAHVDSEWSIWRGATPMVVAPSAPAGLGVTPGPAMLDLTWTAPTGAASYDVHYTSSTTVAPDAAVQTGASPSAAAGWVDTGHRGTDPSLRITGLTNGTAYRVRVRGVNSAGDGAWAWATGTPKTTTSGSPDASLSALALADLGGSVSLAPSFSSTTYAYTANSDAWITSATVTPTVNQSNATVKVNGTSVASGSASGAIDLSYGANRIIVEVTAQAGNTLNYAITVTRALPTVSWSLASGSKPEGETFERTFEVVANDMVGTLTYAAGTASLTDDVGSGRSTGFTMSVGDTHASTISVPFTDDALNEENETFTITIEPGTGYTVGSPNMLTVTIIDDDPPAAPGGLAVVPGGEQLTASWTKPGGPVTGYQARWKETAAPDSDATGDGTDPSTGWVEGGAVSSSSLSQTITGLTNDTGYDVQVRATDGTSAGADSDGYGPWTATKAGTPITPTYEFRFASQNTHPAAGPLDVDVVLSVPAPAGGLELTLTQLLGDDLPEDLCTGTLAESDDIGANPPTSVTVPEDSTRARVKYPIADNGDDLNDGTGECFALRVGTSAAGWSAGDKDVLKLTILVTLGRIAMGSNVASTAKYTATVEENVSGGTLSVPVTVDYLPASSTTFTIAVLSGGTATEGTDFSIATKTVTFTSSDATKTQNLTVTITDDALAEDDETIELGIVAAPQNDPTSNRFYNRNANGRLAQITIQSEDAAPAAVTGLTVAAGNARLDLSWTAPADTGSAALSGYDVHYTSAPATGSGAVLDDAPASGNDASAAWVAVTRTGTTATQAITSLTNDTAYRVRVRAVNAAGGGPWEHSTGTPAEGPTYGFDPDKYTVQEGGGAELRVVLSEAAPAGGLAFTLTTLLGDDVPSDRCINYTGAARRATAADIGSNPPTSLTVAGGNTTARVRLGTVADLVSPENDECLAVRLAPTQATIDAGWTLAAPGAQDDVPNVAQIIIFDIVPPSAPTGLTVTAGDARLDLAWTAPTETFGHYDVHYTSAASSAVPNDQPASGGDPSAAWVAVSRSGTAATQAITGLTNGTTYRVRVRAVHTSTLGAWEWGSGTPQAPPGAVTNLDVSADSAKLDLTWTAPSGTITGYDVHYTSASAADVPNNDPASGGDPAAAWVAVTRTGTTASQSITGLTNDTSYRVRVRAVNAVGGGAWEFVVGTPSAGPSPNANLGALTATWSSGSGYASLALAPAFDAGTTAYTATAPNAATHVKVRPTAAHAAASVTVNGTTVSSGQESAAIPLGTPGSRIAIEVTAEDGTTKDYSVEVSRRAAVTLDASPNPAPEGSSVTVTATLTAALGADVTIPLTLTPGTAEAGDHGALASIAITAGATTGTGTITTARDDDSDDETFTVELGTTLPSSVEAGTPSSVEVRIADVPSVTLEASPVEVEEGERVTVTARLSRAIANTVMIPVTTTRGTSEPGDHGTLTGILISSGATSGEGTISTREDDDIEDETFTVAVRNEALPSPLVAGDPTSVEVFIVDIDTLSITLRSNTLRPSEGSTARLTATLSHPAPEGGVTVQFTANGSGDNPAAPVLDYTLDPPSEAQNATAAITIAEGQRTARATLRVVNDTEPEDDEGISVGIATETVLGDKLPEPLELTIPANDGGGGSTAVAWLDAVPNPVEEGREVEIDVWLSQALEADARVPLTVTRGTSEEGDHGTLDEVVVAAGSTRGTGTISTARDDDADDETFTVRLGSPLPAGVRAGTPSRIEVEIADLDQPRVGLEVDPDVVPEGDPVTVTAVLTAPLSRAVTIPLETVRGTSESGDHGTLRSIRIASGDTEGTGRITTRVDTDTDDETFSVVLGDNLPDGVAAGFPDSVEVLITDGTPTDDAAVSLTAEPLEVPEGESVTVTATLEKPLARTVTIPVTTRRGTSESGDHGSLSGIRIDSGETEGTGTVTTSVDTDTDDETFSVVLRANQPTGVSVGYPDSVEITIADRGGDAPGRVRNLRVTAGNERLDLTWSPPSSGTVDVYQGEYKERSATEWTAIYESGGNYADTEATLQGANGTTYDVRVRASNEYGVGPWATGSGTPTAGGGSSDLRSLSVRVSATTDGSYRSVSLSPSFRSSVTAYKTTAPVGTKYAKFRPTSRTAVDMILVGGHEVASGAESPAVAVHHGVPVWISVLPTGDGPVKEYTVTFTIPAASADAGRSVTSAVDAALAVVGTLSPEHAAEALLGERSLADERLEALDRLGNANGRYDVGDLLAWIERCRAGGARCGDAAGTMPPASDAALPGAIGAAAKRPRRRAPGGRVRKRRRWRGLAVLLAAALWSCEGGGIVDLPATADVPEPGTLAVEWTAPAGSPAAAGALVEIDGPHVGDARAHGGLELYAAEPGNGPRRFVLAGAMRNGAVLEFEVPDRRQAGLYSVRVVEVAGEDHRLLEPDGYRAGIASN